MTQKERRLHLQRSAQQLEAWLRQGDYETPLGWAASGECARLMVSSMRRYALKHGSLDDPQVRRDLLAVQQFATFLLTVSERRAA